MLLVRGYFPPVLSPVAAVVVLGLVPPAGVRPAAAGLAAAAVGALVGPAPAAPVVLPLAWRLVLLVAVPVLPPLWSGARLAALRGLRPAPP